MELQRNNDWHIERLGRFTGSQINRLMGKKGLGDTGKTYAFENAIEIVFGRDEEDFISFDMQRGIQLEPFAFKKFKELKELEFISVEETGFWPYRDNAGASPDGLVGLDACLEIKCPKAAKFFKLVAKGIEAIDEEYYDQMQMEMLSTNCNSCYFFNYIVYKGEEMWHEIIVQTDEERK
jgi:hypothetical protein